MRIIQHLIFEAVARCNVIISITRKLCAASRAALTVTIHISYFTELKLEVVLE